MRYDVLALHLFHGIQSVAVVIFHASEIHIMFSVAVTCSVSLFCWVYFSLDLLFCSLCAEICMFVSFIDHIYISCILNWIRLSSRREFVVSWQKSKRRVFFAYYTKKREIIKHQFFNCIFTVTTKLHCTHNLLICIKYTYSYSFFA